IRRKELRNKLADEKNATQNNRGIDQEPRTPDPAAY
ncbi:unnamed protein product, partial [marine sediment metagenome]